MSQPTPDRGSEAAGIALIAGAVRLLENSLAKVSATTEVGKDVMAAIRMLAKHATPGATQAGAERTAITGAAMQAQQDNPLMQALRAQKQMPPAGGAGAAGAPPVPAAA